MLSANVYRPQAPFSTSPLKGFAVLPWGQSCIPHVFKGGEGGAGSYFGDSLNPGGDLSPNRFKTRKCSNKNSSNEV